MLTINQVADRLHTNTDEVIMASGHTLGDLMHTSELAFGVGDWYRQVPVIPESALDTIRRRIENTEL